MGRKNKLTINIKVPVPHFEALHRFKESSGLFLQEAVEMAIEKLCPSDNELNEYCRVRDTLKRLESK